MPSPVRPILLRRVLPALALALAGIAVLLAGGGSTLATAVGLFLLGAAGVLAVSFVFLEIGLAEDRERAEAARGRGGEGHPGPPSGRPRRPRRPRRPGA